MTATQPTEPTGATRPDAPESPDSPDSPESPESTASAPAPRRRVGATDLALIASFAALISVLTYLGAVPVGGAGVPITLQTFGVMLAGCLLGPVRGMLAVLLYLGLGFIGLPVFAEHTGGVGVLSQPSAGYLVSFPLAALVGGLMVKYVAGEAGKSRALFVFVCSIAASIVVVHPFGIAGLMIHLDLSLREALNIDVLYWVGDLLKTTCVALIAAEVHRAFPRLLPARPRRAGSGSGSGSSSGGSSGSSTARPARS